LQAHERLVRRAIVFSLRVFSFGDRRGMAAIAGVAG